MQRCNGFLISGIALTAGAPLCISWFGLVGFYFGALSLVVAAVISWIVYFWLIYLVLTRPHNQRFVERFILIVGICFLPWSIVLIWAFFASATRAHNHQAEQTKNSTTDG
ncbi:hypothetical protein [Escherichia fergusonii]|uniref:Membrane protein n=1 Tax=Escherichia fergusonii (strain ATCC 35469 / DSM 13698 / CCUG 18766 / IAM 14443 / JCM 21226 / LMG 7866 / NBRC 102419 / NCTC 12128 / CDC 0568-73) TaxID=585054 RepID=B7LJI1_ESCF3|nr:hypothetical protein [Escherichia fergusonii]EFF0767974.1 hypothetical protein [Escherichia fergusonii]EFL4497018.1 hypothetical protein [Escherichia fergusonii]EGC94280.1 hypothetical protein ECD227_0518 [Escherichia fergusonii ECD227]EHG5982721.1 hypothetical protein [Escherichia fergusonii]EHG5990698.1 hypothetical protein [Escherichia fergusonii]